MRKGTERAWEGNKRPSIWHVCILLSFSLGFCWKITDKFCRCANCWSVSGCSHDLILHEREKSNQLKKKKKKRRNLIYDRSLASLEQQQLSYQDDSMRSSIALVFLQQSDCFITESKMLLEHIYSSSPSTFQTSIQALFTLGNKIAGIVLFLLMDVCLLPSGWKGHLEPKYNGERWSYGSPATEKSNFAIDGRDTVEQVRRVADPEHYLMIDEGMGAPGGISQSIQGWLCPTCRKSPWKDPVCQMVLNVLDTEEELWMSRIDFLPKTGLSYAIRQKIYVPVF